SLVAGSLGSLRTLSSCRNDNGRLLSGGGRCMRGRAENGARPGASPLVVEGPDHQPGGGGDEEDLAGAVIPDIILPVSRGAETVAVAVPVGAVVIDHDIAVVAAVPAVALAPAVVVPAAVAAGVAVAVAVVAAVIAPVAVAAVDAGPVPGAVPVRGVVAVPGVAAGAVGEGPGDHAQWGN